MTEVRHQKGTTRDKRLIRTGSQQKSDVAGINQQAAAAASYPKNHARRHYDVGCSSSLLLTANECYRYIRDINIASMKYRPDQAAPIRTSRH